ncbi:hypothetical protein PQR07_40495 [Paraburkholderia aspalathi]
MADAMLDRLMQRHHRSRLPVNPSERHPQNSTSWSPNSTRTNKEIYNQHRATPNPAESVTFAEIRIQSFTPNRYWLRMFE